MRINKASEQDIPLIHDLAERIWWPAYSSILSAEQISFMLENMYSDVALTEQMREGIQFLLAEDKGIPVGFAGYSLEGAAEKPILKIHKLYILPSEQGRGTGRLFMQHLMVLASELGSGILELNVNRANPALAFYLRMGFEIADAVDIPYYQFEMNDYVMRKTL